MIAFLTGALTLFGFGAYLLGDSAAKFLSGERASIPSATVFGHHVWMSWVMIAAMFHSVIPPIVLGHTKQPLARDLYDKALETSATLDKRDCPSCIQASAACWESRSDSGGRIPPPPR